MRNSFQSGIDLLRELQKKLKHVPKRKHIRNMVKTLIKEAGLRDDKREYYFKLLATCALMGKESMYNNFKRRKKYGSKSKESRKEN